MSKAAIAETEQSDQNTPSVLNRIWTRLRPHLLVILLYALVAVAFTWPLVLSLREQSPAVQFDYVNTAVKTISHDRDHHLFHLWWVKKALVDLHVNPYYTDYLYYPDGVPLYLQTLVPVNGLLGIVVNYNDWLGWLGTYNVVCLIIFWWCGYFAFLLADYVVKDKRAAFAAGLFFTLAPSHFYNLRLAQFHSITLQYLPLYLLFFLKLEHLRQAQPGWRNFLKSRRWWTYTLLAAFCLVLINFSDQYLLLYSLAITGLYYAWYGLPLLWKHNWREVGGMLTRTLPAILLAGVALLPFVYKSIQVIRSGKFEELSGSGVPSDILALFSVPVQNIFIGGLASEFGKAFPIKPDLNGQSVGLVALGLAIYAAVRCREARWWSFVAIVGVILSLGSELQIGTERTGFPLPNSWVSLIPVFDIMRYSKRWVGPATLMMAIAAAYALRFHLQRLATVPKGRWKQNGLLVAVLLVFIFEIEPWPFPLSGDQGTLPKAYANHVLPKDDRALLEVPYFQRKKGLEKSVEMYRQTAHERPILGGYTSRDYKFDYNNTTLTYFIDGYDADEPDFVKVDVADMRAVLAYHNFGFIVIYKKKDKIDPTTVRYWRDLVGRLLAPDGKSTPYYEDDELILYELPDRAKVLAEATKPILLKGVGWSGQAEKQPDNTYYRWIIGQEATMPLFVPPASVTNDKVYRFNFKAAAYNRERTMEVLVNNQKVTQLKIIQPFQAYQLEIDSKWFKEGDNLITLRSVEPADRPSDVEKSADTRPLSILVNNMRLVTSNKQ